MDIEQKLSTLPALGNGSHPSLNDGACIMEAVSYIAGENWSDHPKCACPVITAFLISWNDELPDEDRDRLLRPIIPTIINTRSTKAVEKRREKMAADWFVRVYTPAWLRLAGLNDQAATLESFPEIVDFAKCPSLMPALNAILEDSSFARTAVWAVAWATARAAAGAAAGDAARAAARTAVWDAAGAAAEAAARAAAQAAAQAAVWAAVWAAAQAALKPVVAKLQESALELVKRMVACDDQSS